jgi:hypothetical protein
LQPGLVVLLLLLLLPPVVLILSHPFREVAIPLGCYAVVFLVKRKDPLGPLFYMTWIGLLAALLYLWLRVAGAFFWTGYARPVAVLAFAAVILLELRRFLENEHGGPRGRRRLAIRVLFSVLLLGEGILVFARSGPVESAATLTAWCFCVNLLFFNQNG